MFDFGRLITAMVTPFNKKGDVDYKQAIQLAHFLVQTGTQSIVVAGTTGESPTLTHPEESTLFKTMVENFKGKTPILAGTGSNCTKTAITSTKEAEALGVDGSLQVVPYYNRPSQEGIYAHFSTIASATSLPIILYNIPSRTGRNMEPTTVAKLAKIPNIIGLKESSGSIDQLIALKHALPSSFLLYSGDDCMTLPFLKEGAHGVISVASHCVGELIHTLITAFLSDDMQTAERIHAHCLPLFEGLFDAPNPTLIKAVLNHMGVPVGGLRLPLLEATLEQKEKVYLLLKEVLAP